MTYVKWTFYGLIALLVAAFLHYTLPQQDIVRITDTYEKRENPSENPLFWSRGSNSADPYASRDVFFIQSNEPDGSVIVYRNEDTGWGWPPYFKFDTSNLQAEAANLRSTSESPRWVVVTHYGWRITWITVYPNAVGIREVDGPDVTLIPWLNIILLTTLAALFWAVRVRWNRFWDRRVDPVLDRVGDGIDDSAHKVRGLFGRK